MYRLFSLEEIIVCAIKDRLLEFKNNQSKAAKSLKISRGCFRKYMKKETPQAWDDSVLLTATKIIPESVL